MPSGISLGPVPLSPVNWAAGELTLQALNHSSSEFYGVAYYDVPVAPEVIASNIGKYVQSAAKSYLVQGLLPISGQNISAGSSASDAQILQSVTTLQTSLEQMFATVGLVVLILIAAIALLIVGIGSLPLTVSAVQTVLDGKEGNGG